jgi:polyhydroxybutyrate depolymerase
MDLTRTAHTLIVDGLERRFEFAVPPNAAAPLPLVIEFHGSGHAGADQMAASGFADLARTERFAVAAPDALIPVRTRPDWLQGHAWHVPGVPLVTDEFPERPPDDVAFVRTLIAALVDGGIADAQRVYLTGFSGGARMCSYVAGMLAPRIAAFGTVAGLRVPPDAGAPPPPAIAIHSRADQINPFEGGLGARWDLGVEETEAAFAARYHLTGPAVDIHAGIVRHAYRGGRGDERLVTYTLADALHNWPGSRDVRHRFQYGQTQALDATALFWSFFLERRAAGMTDG